MRVGLSYLSSWEIICDFDPTQMDERPPCCVLIQREDNSQCILLMQRGWSASLVAVPRIYGVSILWCTERISEGRVKVVQEPTKRMLADCLTKLMQPELLYSRGILIKKAKL